MRIPCLLLLAASAAAASPTTTLHETFVSHVTLRVHQAPPDGWISSTPRWEVSASDMNPIVTNPLARARYEALAEADFDQESPWALWVHADGEPTRTPLAPHAAFSPEGGPPQFHLEFLVRMSPAVQALELRHGEDTVHTWTRPAEPPPAPGLEASCRLPANNAPARCSFRWEPPPEGTWVQLMTAQLRRDGLPFQGSWSDAGLAPGPAVAHALSRRGRLVAELTVTDGFHCLAQRARTRP